MNHRYGLYPYGGAYPFFSGTRQECKERIDHLTPAQRTHGWTITPVQPDYPDFPVKPATNRIWASVGFCVLLAVVIVTLLMLKGCAGQ